MAATHIYLILRGEVSLMRRPENLYDSKTGKQIKPFSGLQCVMDPSHSGNEKLGLQLGVMRGQTLICEDAGLFQLPLSYSVVAASPEGVLMYQIPTAEALAIWPSEC